MLVTIVTRKVYIQCTFRYGQLGVVQGHHWEEEVGKVGLTVGTSTQLEEERRVLVVLGVHYTEQTDVVMQYQGHSFAHLHERILNELICGGSLC